MTRRQLAIRLALGLAAVAIVLASGSPAEDDDRPQPPPSLGPIDVTLPPYNARGDGVTDDSAAVQKAIDANPGKVILLRDRRPGPSPDYYFGKSLALKGHGQALRGECDGWGGRVTLKFARGVTGIQTDNNACQAASVADLNLEGSEPWWGVYPEEAVLPEGFGGGPGSSSADGIRIRANFVRVENCAVRYFGRHGINIGSSGVDAKAFGDSFYIATTYVGQNRGCGLHIQGGDSNAGTTIQLRSYSNQLWGIYDRSFLGNTHISPLAATNHFDGTPGKSASKVWAKGGDESTGGPYKSTGGAVGNTWIGPYAEADQPPPEFNFRDVVVGGAMGPGSGTPHFWINTWANGFLAWNVPFLAMTSKQDLTGIVTFKAGKTAGQDIQILARDLDDSPAWSELRGVFTPAWEWWEGEVGKGKKRMAFARGGATSINAAGSSPLRLNLDGGTGGIQFGNGKGGIAAAITAHGAVALAPTRDADAPAGSIFLGADHGGQPCAKGGDGKVVVLGPAAAAARVRRKATIPRGQVTVVVEHGLGSEPEIEDVGVLPLGAARVWLAGLSAKTLTFRTDSPAPAAGVEFIYSATR